MQGPSDSLSRAHINVRYCPVASLVPVVCADEPPDAIVVIVPGGRAGLALVEEFKRSSLLYPVLFIVKESSEELAVASLNAGITRYLREPVSDDVLLDEISAVVRRSPAAPSTEPPLRGGERLVGDGPSLCSLRSRIARAARCNSNVLITGETGTGKELVAELIHENSARRQRPFVSLNSTAIPDSLLESELFGFERGAFTGAQQAHDGKLLAANQGTIFFDEIGDTSTAVQAKLLRALDGKQIYRLGSNKATPLDVRIVAATNQNLEEAVADNRFRRDLYYRLNVIRLTLPPLRERLDDVPQLAAHFIRELNGVFGTQVERLSPVAIDGLLTHNWPGNIRELKNILELAFVSLPNPDATTLELPSEFTRRTVDRDEMSFGERDRIIRTLVATNWNRSRAADRLRWSRMTLYRKLERYRIALPRSHRGRNHDGAEED